MPTIKAKLGRLWSSRSLSAISVASVVAFAAIELSAGRDREVIASQTVAIARQTAELKRQADELDRLAERSIRDRKQLRERLDIADAERKQLEAELHAIRATVGAWEPEGESP